MLRNTLKTTVFLAALGGLMVAVGSIFGRGGAVIGLVLGLVTVGAAYWGSDKLAIRAARAVPADPAQYPQYHQIVAELSQRAGIPMPRLYISPEQQPNAFATGRNP
ncbi:MAG TPA: protease HtpX, partial [Acidimicrobiales bacterium]|nr:protease HtpX [Acidimicrobiales bacterium]